jgi:lipopolysaccharide transport system ATP-binding protein
MSIVIEVDDVWKKYRLGVIGTGTLRHDFERWWHRVRGKPDPHAKVGEIENRSTEVRDQSLAAVAAKAYSSNRPAELGDDEVWALRGVSFEVKEGEILGIIGRNGAGKSTLLKILSRVTSPTKGEVRIKGRIISLLEVGTGFHPELTGRENIFLNGAILGMTKAEIKSKFDEIVAFAETEKFLDTPVKRYSSGMYVRLAFAVAAHLEPEILIVDEVLAVGDATFQKKCLGKMRHIAKGGRTVLFVSHNMGAVTSLCPKAMWLDKGTLRRSGSARSVVNDYLTLNPSHAPTIDFLKAVRGTSDGRLRLLSLTWLSSVPLQHGQPLRARIDFQIESPVEDLTVGIGFSTLEGLRLLTYETDYQRGFRPTLKAAGFYSVEVEVDALPLAPAIYALDVGCRSGDTYSLDYVPSAAQIEIIPGAKTPGYIVRQDAGVRLHSRWTWPSS